MWLKWLKKEMPLSYHQLCTSKYSFEQEPRQVLEMQHGKVTDIKKMGLNIMINPNKTQYLIGYLLKSHLSC